MKRRNMKDLSQIEKALLERELGLIRKGLVGVGKSLAAVFTKYGKDGEIKGEFAGELTAFLVDKVVKGQSYYHTGYSTSARINANASAPIPDALKEAILAWAIDDFMGKVKEIEQISQ